MQMLMHDNNSYTNTLVLEIFLAQTHGTLRDPVQIITNTVVLAPSHAEGRDYVLRENSAF